MPFELTIATGSGTPIYRQIFEQIRLAISLGTLHEGDSLPSVRAVAERLVINPNTVARAYADLTREGLVLVRPGIGLFVAAKRQVFSEAERERRLEQALDDFIHAALPLVGDPSELRERLRERLNTLASPEKLKETV